MLLSDIEHIVCFPVTIDGGQKTKYNYYKVIQFSGLDGYEAHLQLLHSVLYEMLTGKITNNMFDIAQEHSLRNPRNALASYLIHKVTDGNYEPVYDILMDDTLFPFDRLPTSFDRCGFYLWQYELPRWEPCEKYAEHPGIDFLFVAELVLRLQRSPGR